MPLLRRPAYVSAALYTGASLAAAGAFLLATGVSGDYTWVARLGGAVWVFLLSLIILTPTVTPWVKKKNLFETRDRGGNEDVEIKSA